MAVTEILGTDSLSSSRITINDNFLSLEDEIADLKGYLDPTAATLSGVTLSTTQLEVGGSAISNTAATLGVATTINANIDMGAAVIYSGVSGSSVLLAANSFFFPLLFFPLPLLRPPIGYFCSEAITSANLRRCKANAFA